MHKPWHDWDLQQWLTQLENRHTQEIQLGLTRVKSIAEKLNLLSPECTVITVTGTNGKGSTVSALAEIYHAAGYKTGSYTSPHLIHFNERIQINLTAIADEELCKAFCSIEEARDEIHLTYFETATLAALLHFQQQHLDVIILEVGLGGRLDATNIIDADLAIITTIDYDHQDYLGTTLEAIAYEKAGIVRQGKPLIYADTNPPSSIIDVANSLASPCYYYGTQYHINEQNDSWDFKGMNEHIKNLPKPQIQLKAAAAAIMACLLLRKTLPIAEEHFYTAMKKVFISGRLQFHPGTVNILYDVAHNAQSARLLAETIKTKSNNGTVHAVFSALKDKDLQGLISPLRDCVDRWYPALLTNKRAASANMLLSVFKEAGIFVEICYNSPLIAFEEALNQATPGDLVVVFGSFFTVGHVMAAQHKLLEQKEIL